MGGQPTPFLQGAPPHKQQEHHEIMTIVAAHVADAAALASLRISRTSLRRAEPLGNR